MDWRLVAVVLRVVLGVIFVPLVVELPRMTLPIPRKGPLMFAQLVTIFKIPELRQKIFITLLFLAVYRIGYYVPLPMIDQAEAGREDEHGRAGRSARCSASCRCSPAAT